MTRTEARRFGKHRRIVTMIIAAIAVIGLAAVCVAVRPWTLAGHVTATGQTGRSQQVDVSTLRTQEVTKGVLNAETRLGASLQYDDASDFAAASGTITQLPVAGKQINTGEQVYEMDGAPVPLFHGDRPFWRTIGDGVSDGPDVTQLEQNLQELGFYGGEVGPHFNWLTREAIRQWQRSLGLTGDAVTGTFDPNTVALAAAAPIRITAVNAKLGQSQVSPASYTGVTLHAQATLTATQAATFKAGEQGAGRAAGQHHRRNDARLGRSGRAEDRRQRAIHTAIGAHRLPGPVAGGGFRADGRASHHPERRCLDRRGADRAGDRTDRQRRQRVCGRSGTRRQVGACAGVNRAGVRRASANHQVRRPQGGRQGGGLMNDIEFAPAGPEHGALLTLEHVTKAFPGKDGSVLEILHDTSLAIDRSELVAIVGPSGSGKSTLLSLLGTLDMPTSGILRYDGGDVNAMGERQRSVLRAARIGFVFQQFHLIATVSALENVMTGLQYTTLPRGERRQRAAEALEQVGLGNRLHHRPAQLSGGEQQRVAIARALAKRPDIIFADEPTGALDCETGHTIVDLLLTAADSGASLVMVTHDQTIAAHFPRRLHIQDGLVTELDKPNQAPSDEGLSAKG